MDYYDRQDELYHYGRKGMKWGQNIFGKVKSGASRVGRKISDAHQKKKAEKAADRLRKKPYSKLTDEELKARIQRMQLEKNLKDLDRQVNPTTDKGSKFLSSATKAASEAFINAGKDALTGFVKNRLYKALGLTDELDDLKKEFDKLDIQNKINDAKKKLSGEKDEMQSIKERAEKARLNAEIEENERKTSPEAAKRREKEEHVKDRELDARLKTAEENINRKKPSNADEAEYASNQKKIIEAHTAKAKYDQTYGDTSMSDAKRSSDTEAVKEALRDLLDED